MTHPLVVQDGKGLVEIMPGDGPESAVAGLLAAFGTVTVQEAQSRSADEDQLKGLTYTHKPPSEAPRAVTKVAPLALPLITPVNPTISTPCLPANRRDGPPTFGSPCRAPSQGLDPIPDEGFRSMPMAVGVPEWRWCIPSSNESPCMLPHTGSNGAADQGPCSNLRLPFGRNSGQAQICGTMSVEECGQLVILTPAWNKWQIKLLLHLEGGSPRYQLPKDTAIIKSPGGCLFELNHRCCRTETSGVDNPERDTPHKPITSDTDNGRGLQRNARCSGD
eukprot:CAMPEP_0169419784 /NCGR_PEP_ID=MMETSP1017-20121227/65192_1 /TAXON_ID=342587 /ORGANISM="Karlodinium micrum, Strain CCMP2283" /LENGTH=276 /DNA_ID=CAMNT_0009528525 /DNA_START=206 /DNA_END=1034 /DNA_ORIENTATION=-